MDRSAEFPELMALKKVVVGHVEELVQGLQFLVDEQAKWRGLVAQFAILFAR